VRRATKLPIECPTIVALGSRKSSISVKTSVAKSVTL
jgi:hypothetical protein